MSGPFTTARAGLWHLRHGGPSGLRRWRARRRQGLVPRRLWQADASGVAVRPWPLPDRPPARPLRVAVVLDDFSRLALGYEWQQVEPAPGTWREDLDRAPVDLLFVESAWAGNGGAWRHMLTGPAAPAQPLRDLVAHCAARAIPTVFWNKEDPAHFDDFLATAALFDHVLTTDEGRVAAYRSALGHDRVGVLGFAAQPAIHNPVRTHGDGPQGDVAFAGTWYAHKYPERREQLETLLGAAIDASPRMARGLDVFSRELGGDARYQFPAPFDAHVRGSLDYPRMLTAYREYKVFLNASSVVDSPTMCARRVFEISACGTPVVTVPTPAISAVFPGDEVLQVRDRAEAAHVLRALVASPELRDRATHRARRRIMRGHTYGHRVADVLAAAGVADPAPLQDPEVSALVATMRPHLLDGVLATLAAQQGVRVQPVVLCHGWRADPQAVGATARAAGLGDVTLLHAPADVPLGECLNLLAGAADAGLVAKIDDDDVYGPHYLADLVDALRFSGADVVGKQAHHVHLADLDALVLRFPDREHRFTDRVMGPTILTRRDVVAAVPFPALPRGEDTAFVDAVVRSGARVYAADRFGFVQVRRAGAAGHTWPAGSAELLATGRVVTFGPGLEHVLA